MKTKYYVVWKGRKIGIFSTWMECKAQVDGFPNAKFKSFPNLEQAKDAFNKGEITRDDVSSETSIVTLSESQINNLTIDVKIFTDGASEPNPGESGVGLALYVGDKLPKLFYGLYLASGTNNIAELLGLGRALQLAKDQILKGNSVAIFSDSKYAINCIIKWAGNWESNGWKKDGGEIKNLELIKDGFYHYKDIKEYIAIYHVNAHTGIEGNELADRMSIIAIENKEEEFVEFKGKILLSDILSSRRV